MIRALAVVAALAVTLTGAAACTSSAPSKSPGVGPSGSGQGHDDPAALLSLGIQQGTQGDIAAAKSTFTLVTTLDKNNKFAWFNLGVIAQNQGDTAEAIRCYDAALAVDGAFTSALYNKAIIVEGTDVAGAITLYQKIVSLNPQAATSYLRLGLLQDKQGDHAGAVASFRSAVAADASLVSSIPSSYHDEVGGS